MRYVEWVLQLLDKSFQDKMLFRSLRAALMGVLAYEANIVSAAWPQDVDVDSFISTERGIAFQGALNNIGPNGSLVPGAGAGYVVASPSKENPNCV